MKKIAFDDKYKLTQAVLEGRKTQTRRIIKCPREFQGEWVAGFNIHIRQSDKKVVSYPCMYDADEREFEGGEILPHYKAGEVVAVAQSYADLELILMFSQAGWKNKRLVEARLMPYQIMITNIRIERLQNISDEDCLAEGVYKGQCGSIDTHLMDAYYYKGGIQPYCTPREAYAALIDKVSGKGTWESNPWVWVYEFELVKPLAMSGDDKLMEITKVFKEKGYEIVFDYGEAGFRNGMNFKIDFRKLKSYKSSGVFEICFTIHSTQKDPTSYYVTIVKRAITKRVIEGSGRNGVTKMGALHRRAVLFIANRRDDF